eukprot:scaffold301_cov243-Pinguiococcus_pyrenoidosus.AAC.98
MRATRWREAAAHPPYIEMLREGDRNLGLRHGGSSPASSGRHTTRERCGARARDVRLRTSDEPPLETVILEKKRESAVQLYFKLRIVQYPPFSDVRTLGILPRNLRASLTEQNHRQNASVL